ncbi:MAG: thioredoxin domain-containing protein [Sphingomicrobium sp.]
MMKVASAVAMALALQLTPAAAAAKPTRAPVSRDWTRTVAVTSEGGFRMGNPAAKVSLIEYGSLACPHCRHFEETGYKPLVQGYVRTGKVSYEFRNLLLNGPDISISLLTRCAGPAKFFPMSEQVYATQEQWEKKIEDMSEADKAALEKMTDQQRVIRFAELGGMPQLAERFGVTPAKARQCLSDSTALTKLIDMTKAANDHGIDHTPTFLINGKVSDAATWEQLEPELKKALGG